MAQYDEEDPENPLSSKGDVNNLEDLAPNPFAPATDDDTGAEVDNNEEIANKSAALMPAYEGRPPSAMSAPDPRSAEMAKYQNFMDEYKRLQEGRQKGLLTAGLLQAGGQIGQSMAGKYSGNFKPDESGIETMKAIANQPVKDYEEGQKVNKLGLELKQTTASQDPASDQSKLFRQYLKTRFGFDLPETTSAADAMMLIKSAGKPSVSKFQSKTGIYVDDNGKEHKILASYDPGTGKIFNTSTGQEIPNDKFIPEGLNPYQTVINPTTGLREQYNKSRGGSTSPLGQQAAPISQAQTPQEVWASLDPKDRTRMDKEYRPAFNKLTEKTVQRLGHVDPILQRLQEAVTNPAALSQAKAEIARFDVGDQRLAQQEFNMFLQRHGYKGWEDWMSEKTAGTIPQDLADQMSGTIKKTATTLQNEVNQKAEEQAKLLVSRLPKGQKVDPKLIAPLLYGNYSPAKASTGEGNEEMVKVTSSKSGKSFLLPKSKVDEALKKKLINPIQAGQ